VSSDKVRPPTIAKCDDCGGPTWWTVFRGFVYYLCQRDCSGLRQLDMFIDVEYIDRVSSVSALRDEGEGGCVYEDSDLPW